MIFRLLLFALAAGPLTAEEFVPHAPSETRLFLRVPDDGEPLKDLRVSIGQALPGGHADTQERRARLSDISFPITWWKWRDQVIRFTPAHNGLVELDLNGPWGEAKPGQLQQQEVLWDAITAEGAELANGGFEEIADGRPAGWDSPWRPYPAPDVWPLQDSEPLEGKRCAAAWHGRPLVGKLAVKAGVPVTLTVHARAATVPGFQAPARLPRDTPAHRACAKLKRGVNLGNCWEAPPGTWGIHYDTTDIDKIADQGFDHVRVPVAWQYHLQDGVISPGLLEELEPVLKRALDRGLTVILNWQHFEDLIAEPEKNRAAFVAGWRAVAGHFKDWPPELYLELLNEPNGALDGDVLTSVHAGGIAAIRESNPKRVLLVDPPSWAGIRGLDRLFLPDGDDRVIVTVHSYEPFQFTHQQASWVNYQDLRDISYPGPPSRPVAVPDSLKDDPGIVAWIEAYNTRQGSDNPCGAAAFEVLLDEAVAWSEHFGRPVHIGEFGCITKAGSADRRRYVRDFRIAAEKRGLPWAMWDWKAGFAYWDSEKDQPLLRDDLFGK